MKNKAMLKSKKIVTNTTKKSRELKKLNRANANRLLLGLSALSLVLVMAVTGGFLSNKPQPNVISEDTLINGVNIGGLNNLQAEQLLYSVFSKKADEFSLTINHDSNSWTLNKSDFVVNSNIHTIIEEAQKHNELLDDYDLQKETLNQFDLNGFELNVAFDYVFVGLSEKIDNIIKQIEVEPTNSQISFNADKENSFEISNSIDGLRVNKEQLYYDINNQFKTSNVINVDVVTFAESAEITKSSNQELVAEVSSFKTMVADSTGNRKKNVALALDKFNGFVIEPGQEVSFNEVSGPHNYENGYKNATIIYKGQYVDGVGGGVCQASTTLYNALLLADVEILEVHKHTLPVKYVPLAMDAMVSDNLADLKFKNNSEYPIYIKTKSTSDSVEVKLFTKQPEYTIKTKSSTIKTIDHLGDKIVTDTNKEYVDKVLFKGETFRLTYPRQGFEAAAVKEYYKNNQLIKSEQIRHEVYSPQAGIIIEGGQELPAGMEIINEQEEHVVEPSGFIPSYLCP